jgi:hypothetical protein
MRLQPEILLSMIFSTLLFVVLPMVYLFLQHQRKMAELIHGVNKQREIEASSDRQLLEEVVRLREAVAQQSIALDTVSQSQRALEAKFTTPDELSHRVR